MSNGLYLSVELANGATSPALTNSLDGRTFQVHRVNDRVIKLIPVTLTKADHRCPIIVGGEQCGERAGHDGKHMWAGGD